MKYKGKQVTANVDYCVIPRPDEDIAIKCKSVPDFDEFDAMVKPPVAPVRIKGAGEKIQNLTDPTYRLQLARYQADRLTWLILKSIEDNPDLEFETVDIKDPSTFPNYEDELKKSGFTQVEIGRIQQKVFQVNCLDEAHMEEARQSFLLTMAAEAT